MALPQRNRFSKDTRKRTNLRGGRVIRTTHLEVRSIVGATEPEWRATVTVPAALLKIAVARNRIRRRINEMVRAYMEESSWSGVILIRIVRSPGPDGALLGEELSSALIQSGILRS